MAPAVHQTSKSFVMYSTFGNGSRPQKPQPSQCHILCLVRLAVCFVASFVRLAVCFVASLVRLAIYFVASLVRLVVCFAASLVRLSHGEPETFSPFLKVRLLAAFHIDPTYVLYHVFCQSASCHKCDVYVLIKHYTTKQETSLCPTALNM